MIISHVSCWYHNKCVLSSCLELSSVQEEENVRRFQHFLQSGVGIRSEGTRGRCFYQKHEPYELLLCGYVENCYNLNSEGCFWSSVKVQLRYSFCWMCERCLDAISPELQRDEDMMWFLVQSNLEVLFLYFLGVHSKKQKSKLAR